MENKPILLSHNTIDDVDIKNLVEWLSQKPTPHLTQGELVKQFQREFAKKIGGKSGIFCNSGSSAILLMLQTLLTSGRIKVGDRVLVNALSWSTDVSSIMNLGLVPVLVDCNMNNLSIDLEHLKELIKKDKYSCLLLVSVLGFSPDMDDIIKILNENDIILLEDCCESTMSNYKGKTLGSFGVMSCFSFFYSHHITCLEGGMVVCNDESLSDILSMTLAHGWSKSLNDEKRKEYRDKYNISLFDDDFTFYYPSYNFRNTDLHAKIALGQMKKLDYIVKKRNENYSLYDSLIKNDYWKPNPIKESFTSNLAYPIIHPNREGIAKALNEKNIACRPLIAGSISRHPFYYEKYGKIALKNADSVHDFGLYVPNNESITEEEIRFICNIINSVINK